MFNEEHLWYLASPQHGFLLKEHAQQGMFHV